MSTHADLPGGWRGITLQNVVRGVEPLERALGYVGFRGDEVKKARQDLSDAIAAYKSGDVGTALAVATSLAEELQQAKPGKRAAA